MDWKIYRHKNNPEIRYWVAFATGYPIAYEDNEGEFFVRIKTPRNVRFDKEDLPFTHTPESGLWPMKKFLELYEPEPEVTPVVQEGL